MACFTSNGAAVSCAAGVAPLMGSEGVMANGDHIELRKMPNGDEFDYLNGSRVRDGAQLLVWVEGQWIAARYELASAQPLKIVLQTLDGRRYPLNRATMRFCWPRG